VWARQIPVQFARRAFLAIDSKLFADRFAFDAVLLSIVVRRSADLLQAAIAKDLATVVAIPVCIHE
jgi:hypothetical protein